jgi:hypothetical protein
MRKLRHACMHAWKVIWTDRREGGKPSKNSRRRKMAIAVDVYNQKQGQKQRHRNQWHRVYCKMKQNEMRPSVIKSNKNWDRGLHTYSASEQEKRRESYWWKRELKTWNLKTMPRSVRFGSKIVRSKSCWYRDKTLSHI